MKRMLSAVLAMLMLFAVGSSLAVNIDLGTPRDESEGYSYFTSLAVEGNNVWVMRNGDAGQALVCYPADGSEPQTYTESVDGKKLAMNMFSEQDPDEYDVKHSFHLLVGGERLLGLNHITGDIWAIKPVEGKLSFEPVTTIRKDTGLLYQPEGDSMGAFVNSVFMFAEGDTLYVGNYEWGETSGKQDNVAISLKDGTVRKLNSEKVYRMTPYKDGKLLAVIYDPSNSWDSKTDTRIPAQIGLYDIATDKVEVKGTVDLGDSKLLYVPKLDAPVFFKGGKIMMIQDWSTTKQVGYLPGESSETFCLLGDSTVVGGDISTGTISLREVSKDFSTERRLTIAGSYMDDAARAFIRKHPDVPVYFMDRYFENVEEIGQAMVSGDDSFDIVRLSVNYGPLAEMMKKGYCEDLSAYPELVAQLERLNPVFKQVGMLDGKFYAVASEAYIDEWWVVNKEVLQEIGLTMDDMPTNLVDLCKFVTRWNNEFAAEQTQYRLLESDGSLTKQYLLEIAMKMQMMKCLKNGTELNFNTPEFRQVLQALDTMDARAIDREIQQRQENGEGGEVAYEEEYHEALLSPYYDLDLRTNTPGTNDYQNALAMSLLPGDEVTYSMSMQMFVINPRSANKDLAAEYLAGLYDNMDVRTRVMMLNDQNEPVENARYQSQLDKIDRDIESIQKEYDKEQDEHQKKDLEENLNGLKEWRERYTKEERYEVTQAALDDYHQNVLPHVVIMRNNILNNQASRQEFATLMTRYGQGQMGADQFLKEVDGKLRMMRLENQ